MPSPFPGMNPYLERATVWDDFHESFIPLVRELLTPQVLPNYFVRIDETMYIHELASDERRFLGRGDVLVPALTAGGLASAAAMAMTAAPAEVTLPAFDVERQAFLEVRDRDRNDLITVIELLTPSNKYAGPDREQYLGKARMILHSSVHFVEIDLLRGGPRMPWLGLPPCDYCAVVSRYEQRPKAGFWPIRLRERLPVIPIPLRHDDQPAQLDLQEVLHRIYDAAGYAYFIYRGVPEPALAAADDAWVKSLVPGL